MTRMETLIAKVREFAEKPENYEQGWDVVVEAYEDAEIAKVIGRVRTVQAAIDRMAKAIKPYNERRSEVQAMSGEQDAIEQLAEEDPYVPLGPVLAARMLGVDIDRYLPHVPETFVQDMATAERQAHLIADVVAAGIRQAENHVHTLPTWKCITTPEGAFLPSTVDELHNQIANARGNLSRYLSGEWSVGLDLELGVGMIRDEAFTLRLLELELLRRLDEEENDRLNELGRQAEAAYSRYPAATETGVVCGNCTHRDHNNDRVIVRHATVADVRDCYAAHYDEEQAILAEIEAEKRAEQFFEQGF